MGMFLFPPETDDLVEKLLVKPLKVINLKRHEHGSLSCYLGSIQR